MKLIKPFMEDLDIQFNAVYYCSPGKPSSNTLFICLIDFCTKRKQKILEEPVIAQVSFIILTYMGNVHNFQVQFKFDNSGYQEKEV